MDKHLNILVIKYNKKQIFITFFFLYFVDTRLVFYFNTNKNQNDHSFLIKTIIHIFMFFSEQ